MEVYMWRDRFDDDMVSLGSKAEKKFVCWGQMHIDGIEETFGEEVKAELKRRMLISVDEKGDTEPICVSSDRLAVNGEPLWDQKLEDFC